MTVAVLAALAVLCLVGAATSAGPRRGGCVAVLPHDTRPGYSVERLRGDLQASYRLVDTDASQFFAVLDDGVVMTTRDLAPLVDRPVSLVVVGESPNRTATHTLQLYVLDRRQMLRFAGAESRRGEVPENAPAGTPVRGVPRLAARGGGVGGLPARYAIVSGNEDGAFALLEGPADDEEPDENATTSTTAGVRLVTARPLDRETTPAYKLAVQASDARGIDKALTTVEVAVLDENDNSPVFTEHVYRFSLGGNATLRKRFESVGRVQAVDADGDRVAYRLAVPSNLVVIVPQTGELLLAGDPSRAGEDVEYEITVEAHDRRSPSRTSEVPARVWLQFDAPRLDNDVLPEDPPHRIAKRRVTRAVRPTKRIEFTEQDGETEGRIVFQLEKETERETFKIRDENQWVTVEPNGAVRVKKKWDYEELGPEKTIDFWVTITNAGVGDNLGSKLDSKNINTCFTW